MKKTLILMLALTFVLTACSGGLQPASSDQDLLSIDDDQDLYDHIKDSDLDGSAVAAQDDLAAEGGTQDMATILPVDRAFLQPDYGGESAAVHRGDILYLIDRQELVIVDASDRDAPQIKNKITLTQESDDASYRHLWPSGLHLNADGDRLFLIISGHEGSREVEHGVTDPAAREEDSADGQPQDRGEGLDPNQGAVDDPALPESKDDPSSQEDEVSMLPVLPDPQEEDAIQPAPDVAYASYKNFVGSLVYDVSDPGEPQRIDEFYQEGSFVASRLVDSVLYLISSHHAPFSHEDDEEALTDKMPKVLHGSLQESWQTIPSGNVRLSPQGNPSQQTILSTIDADLRQEPKTQALLGTAGMAYFSDDHLHLFGLRETKEDDRVDLSTDIYRYELGGLELQSAGQANVPGLIQAIDAHQGRLRLLTQDLIHRTFDDGDAANPPQATLLVFDEGLSEFSRLENFAADGGRVHAAFTETKAYLSDPTQGRIEIFDLESPQQPTRLSQMDLDRGILGMIPHGQDQLLVASHELEDEAAFRQPVGLTLTLHDLSDPDTPKQTDALALGDADAYSTLTHPKPLWSDPERGTLALSVALGTPRGQVTSTTDESDVFAGLLVLSIEGDNLQETARIDHRLEDHDAFPPTIHAVLQEGDNLFTLSDFLLKIHDGESFATRSQLELAMPEDRPRDLPLPVEADRDMAEDQPSSDSDGDG